MDLISIRDSAFFTTLLHCILAYSLPNDNVAVQPGPYSIVSPIPNIGILETPSYEKRSQPLLDANFFMVNPRWHGQDNSNSGFGRKVKNDPPLYNPPGTALKGNGLKYPLATPRVKLTFAGTSGMLPVNTQPTPPDKHKPVKVLKPTVSDLTTKPDVSERLINSIKGWLAKMSKSMLLSSSTPRYSDAKVDDLAPTYPGVYSEAKTPINTLQSAPSHKPKLPNINRNPSNFNYPQTINFNYPQTIPEINYRKRPETLTSVTPSYKYIVPDSGPSLNPNINNPANPVLHNSGNLPEKANRYMPYRPNQPETGTLAHKYVYFNPGLPTQQTKSKKPKVLKPTNFDFVSTKPSVEKNVAVALPPVPATMSLLRRTQLVLLNTVAGLPGGRPQALDALRAG